MVSIYSLLNKTNEFSPIHDLNKKFVERLEGMKGNEHTSSQVFSKVPRIQKLKKRELISI